MDCIFKTQNTNYYLKSRKMYICMNKPVTANKWL